MEQTELFESIRKKLFDNSKDIFLWINLDFPIKLIDDIQKKCVDIVSADLSTTNNHFLEEVCQQCENSKTNLDKSEKVADVFSGFVKKKYYLNIKKWEPNKTDYPKYMLLGQDKGILAYAEFFYHNNLEINDGEICYKYGICHEVNELLRKVKLAYSDLDRPVFYIHILDYIGLKGIYFETTEQIKDCLLKGSNSIISFKKKEYYCSNLFEMGLFEELIKVLKDLKKYNVQVN